MLKSRIYKIQAEIQGAKLIPEERIVFVENDVGLNELEITFTKGGAPYNINGVTVMLVFRRPDGVTILASEKGVKEKVNYKLGTSELFCPGTVMLQVCLMEGGRRQTAGQVPIYVENEIPTDNAVDSSLTYPKVVMLSNIVQSLESRVMDLEDDLAVQGYSSIQQAMADILSRLSALENK